MGYPVGLLRDASKGTSTDLNISASLNVQNTIISGSNLSVNYAASSTAPTGATVASVKAWFQTANYGNIMLATNPEVGLTAPFNYLTPDFNPISATSLAAIAG